MADAFRCDNCGDYKDGKPPRHLEVDLGVNGLILGLVFGRVPPEAPTPDSTDALMEAMADDDSALGRLLFHGLEKATAKKDNKLPAELCTACEEELVLMGLARLRSGEARLTSHDEEDDDDIQVQPLSRDQLDQLVDQDKVGGGVAIGPLKLRRRK